MTTRKVSLETKKGYFRHPIDVDKNVAVLTMKDGKPLWFTKSWNASKKQIKYCNSDSTLVSQFQQTTMLKPPTLTIVIK